MIFIKWLFKFFFSDTRHNKQLPPTHQKKKQKQNKTPHTQNMVELYFLAIYS